MVVDDRIDHPAEWPVYDAETRRCAQELIADGRVFDYARGPEIEALEDDFTRRHEEVFALTFNSGTSALLTVYRALGFTNGAEVVVPTFSFLAAAAPLIALGAVPVLCGVSESEGNADVEHIKQCLTAHTKGIVVTHLFGNPCDMTALGDLSRHYGLALVEDCSHAHASVYRGRLLGVHGDAAVFSLGARKMISGGHGGIMLTRRPEIFDLACLIGHPRQRARTSVTDPELRRFSDFGLGGNYCMTPVAAVLALGLAARLDEISRDKQRLASKLIHAAEANLGLRRLTAVEGGDNRTFYDVVAALPAGATADERDQLVARLKAKGMRVRAPSTGLLHRTSIVSATSADLARLGISASALRRMRQSPDKECFRSAEDLHNRLISFPSSYFYGSNDDLVEAYIAGMVEVGAEQGLTT